MVLEEGLNQENGGLPADALDRFETLVKTISTAIAQAIQPSNTPGGKDGNPSGPVDAGALLALLRTLEPHVRKRKPRLCHPVLEALTAASWPPGLFQDVQSLDRFIRKYKFNEARSVLATLVEALEVNPRA